MRIGASLNEKNRRKGERVVGEEKKSSERDRDEVMRSGEARALASKGGEGGQGV